MSEWCWEAMACQGSATLHSVKTSTVLSLGVSVTISVFYSRSPLAFKRSKSLFYRRIGPEM